MNIVNVTQTQIDEAASLINNAIENHATAVDVTGLGVLYYIGEALNIRFVVDRHCGHDACHDRQECIYV